MNQEIKMFIEPNKHAIFIRDNHAFISPWMYTQREIAAAKETALVREFNVVSERGKANGEKEILGG